MQRERHGHSDLIRVLVDNELSRLRDPRVIAHIGSLLVRPEVRRRAWDYGEPDDAYPCWLVLAHKPSNTAIAYCEYGFGPRMPWGLLRLEGTEHVSMGMDSGWFTGLMEAYFDSMAAAELPIWRVFQQRGSDFPGTPITAEAAWDATWVEVERLRREHADCRYNCWHSVDLRDRSRDE